MAEREYKCPYGCKTQYPLATIRGWKRHMSAKHGRFSEAQVQQAENAASGETGDAGVRERMEAFASQIDDGKPVEITPEGGIRPIPDAAAPAAAAPEPEVTRKVHATPRKVKKLLTAIPEKILELFKIIPDDDDKDAIDEVAEFLQSIFGVDFEVDESRTTIRNRWLALLWVLGVVGLVVFKHRAIDLFKPEPEDAFATKDKKE